MTDKLHNSHFFNGFFYTSLQIVRRSKMRKDVPPVCHQMANAKTVTHPRCADRGETLESPAKKTIQCQTFYTYALPHSIPQGNTSRHIPDVSPMCHRVERFAGHPLFPPKNVSPEDLLWGCFLGDGYCNPYGCLTLSHSVSQAPYLFWKWELLRAHGGQEGNPEGWVVEGSRPRLVVDKDSRTNKWTYAMRFNTRTLFQRERELFYPFGEKRFPRWEQTRERWTPAALAVWFMDDGGAGGNSKRGCVIDVSCWGPEGRAEIQRTLKCAYNLETTLQGRKDKGVKLFFPLRSHRKLLECIGPYIVPSMFYKIAHLF